VLGFEITNRNQTEASGQGIRIVGSHNLVSRNSIYNLCFEGIFLAGGPKRGWAITSDNTISYNTIRAAQMAGIHVEGRKNVIEDNDISGTRQYPLGCPRRNRADADGIRFFGSGDILAGNHIHDIAIPGTKFNPDPHTDCFQTWGPAENDKFNSNWCEMPAPFVGQRGASNHFASVENFGGNVSQLQFLHNVVLNVGQGLIVQGDGVAPIVGVQFENNTMENILQEAIILKNATDVHVINCIFVNVGSGKGKYLATDASSAFSASSNDMYTLSGMADDGSMFSLDPQFKIRRPGLPDPRVEPSASVIGLGANPSK
jgi:hypothetical protein